MLFRGWKPRGVELTAFTLKRFAAFSSSMWPLRFVTTSSEEKEAAQSLLRNTDLTHTHSCHLQIPLMKVIRIRSTKASGPLVTTRSPLQWTYTPFISYHSHVFKWNFFFFFRGMVCLTWSHCAQDEVNTPSAPGFHLCPVLFVSTEP